jgi:hypothetical protein
VAKLVLNKEFLGIVEKSSKNVHFFTEQSQNVLHTALKKNYGTHVIRLDIAPKTYPLGQHLFISASNNMFYRHSQ